MSKTADPPLTTPQQEALLELGFRGAGGSFEQEPIGQLFDLGLVEVRGGRVSLTEKGRLAFAALAKGS